jgi:hypothetical protein
MCQVEFEFRLKWHIGSMASTNIVEAVALIDDQIKQLILLHGWNWLALDSAVAAAK